jgi:L-aspartate oxidase
MRAMMAWTRKLRHVRIWENTFTLDLLTRDGACRGALIADQKHGRMLVWAKQTILCTGGAGQLYRESTNPSVATADGHAVAYRAGAELRDMEFMQFHPTVLVHRRQQPQSDHRSHPWRRRVPGRSPRLSVHVRL